LADIVGKLSINPSFCVNSLNLALREGQGLSDLQCVLCKLHVIQTSQQKYSNQVLEGFFCLEMDAE
jgi:hypothetical protein